MNLRYTAKLTDRTLKGLVLENIETTIERPLGPILRQLIPKDEDVILKDAIKELQKILNSGTFVQLGENELINTSQILSIEDFWLEADDD
jgi:hypothetical protein